MMTKTQAAPLCLEEVREAGRLVEVGGSCLSAFVAKGPNTGALILRK